MSQNSFRDFIKRVSYRFHKFGIKFGLYLIPTHYYAPISNINELENSRSTWAFKSKLPGVHFDLDEQATNLQSICLPYQNEYKGNRFFLDGSQMHYGPGYGYIEAQALHSVVRFFKPKQVIEVGSGVSTYCISKATQINLTETGESTKIISIEPFPSAKLKEVSNIEIIPQKVQTVPLELFERLKDGDLLFIDSTHTVKPGGDVNYLILEVLPRLQKGVIVHFHDIYFPYDYQPDVLLTYFHWAETSLLRAFLIFQDKVKIIFCMSQLHYDRKNVLRNVFPEYNPQENENGLINSKNRPFDPVQGHFPTSIFLRM